MTQCALIISHGQPSDPDRAEAELAALASRVAALLPGWRVGSATLAAPGALAQAITTYGVVGRAYPLFMAGGWFTRSHLPSKLAAAGGGDWQVLEPLGCDPALHDLTVQFARQSGAGSLILAAHGSSRSSVPSDIAHHLAGRIARETSIPRVEAAFIDQVPQLSACQNYDPTAACLPYFAASGGHVTGDIPLALAEAGFQGRTLEAIGLAPEIPAIIARAILAGQPVCAERCRWQRG
jgi:sirohydrochlorin ferrochelatase